MSTSIRDYLLDPQEVDWARALAAWNWLLPPVVDLWFASRFADLFFVFPDGSIHMLDVGLGTLSPVADDKADFGRRCDDEDRATDWLMIPLVDRLTAVDKTLGPGECYGFKLPPTMGGGYHPANVSVRPTAAYLALYGEIHGKLKDVPDGEPVPPEILSLLAGGPPPAPADDAPPAN